MKLFEKQLKLYSCVHKVELAASFWKVLIGWAIFLAVILHPLHNYATNDVFWSILLLGAPVLAPQVASPGVAIGCYLLRTGSLMLMGIGLAPVHDASLVTSLSLWGVPFMQTASCLCSPKQPQFQTQVLLHILDSFAAYSLLRRTGMGMLQALLQCCLLWCTLLGANCLALSIVKRSMLSERKRAGMQNKRSKDESISADGPSPYSTTPPPSPISVTSVGPLGSANQTKSGMASSLCQGISMSFVHSLVTRLTGKRLVLRCFSAHKVCALQAEGMEASSWRDLAQGALWAAPVEREGTPPPQQPQQQGAQSPAAAVVGCVTCIDAARAAHQSTVWGCLYGGAGMGGSGGGMCMFKGHKTGPDAWFGGAPCAQLPSVGSSCSAVYVGGAWSGGELPLPVGDAPQWQALFTACVVQPPSNHTPGIDSEVGACGEKAARMQQVGHAVAALAPAPASASAPAPPRPLAHLTRLLANATIPLFMDSVTPAVAEASPPPPPQTQTHRHHHHHRSQPQPHTVATVKLTLCISHPSGHPIVAYKGSACGKPERVPRPAVWCPPAASSGRGRGLRGPLVGAHVGGEVPPAMVAVRCGKVYLPARVVGLKDSVFAGCSCCCGSEDGCGGGSGVGGGGDGSSLWTDQTRGASSGNADALELAGEAAPVPMNATHVFLEISVPLTVRASRPVLVELWAGSVLIGGRPVYLLLRPPTPSSVLTPLPPTQQQRPQPRQAVAAAPTGDHLLMCAQAEVQELAGLAAVHHPASVAALIHDLGALCELLDATEAASETLARDMAGWQAMGLQSKLYDPATQARSAAHVHDNAARSAAARALVASLSRCTVRHGLRATSQRLLTMCGASEAGRALLGPVHWLVATPDHASALTAAAAASGSAGMVRDIAWWLATHAEGGSPASVPTPIAIAAVAAASAPIPAPMATLVVRKRGRQTGEPGASPNINTSKTAAAACQATTSRDLGHNPPSPARPHNQSRDGVHDTQDLPGIAAAAVSETVRSRWWPLKACVVGFHHPEMEQAYSASLAASISPLTAIYVFLPSMVWMCGVAWRCRPGQPEPDIVLVATLLCLLLPLQALCAGLWWLGWVRGSNWLMEVSVLARGLPTTVLAMLQLWWSHTAVRPPALVAEIVTRLDLGTSHPLPSLVAMGIPSVVLAPMPLHVAACNLAIKGASVVAVLAASGGGGVGVVAARVAPWVLACWGPACMGDVVRRLLFVKGWVASQAPGAHSGGPPARHSTVHVQTYAHSRPSSQRCRRAPGSLCGAHRNALLPPGGRQF